MRASRLDRGAAAIQAARLGVQDKHAQARAAGVAPPPFLFHSDNRAHAVNRVRDTEHQTSLGGSAQRACVNQAVEHSCDPLSLSKRAEQEAERAQAESKKLIAKSECGPGGFGSWGWGVSPALSRVCSKSLLDFAHTQS